MRYARNYYGGEGSNPSGDATLANQQAILAALSGVSQIDVVTHVKPSGEITIILGDDYVDDQVILLPVPDAGEGLKNFLQSAAISSVILGAGKGVGRNASNLITGTINAASISHASDVTTIPISITSAQSSAAEPCTSYVYHIKAIDTEGNEIVKFQGKLTVEAERAAVSA